MTQIAILGAGLSGVAMGIWLRRAGIDDFTIYERQSDVGGTWLRNTYPGLHCDIPSHIYCYSFEPNPDFSMVYSGQVEIQAYIRRCAEKYDILGHIRFGVTVDAARYDEANARWTLEIEGAVVHHQFVVSATGGLTEPHLPRIEGRETFEGEHWHAGAWRHDVRLAGKRVAVVGSAASAVQVVPEVAKEAASVTVFSRTPNWVTPRGNRTYSEPEKASLRQPGAWSQLRRHQYRRSLLWHGAFRKRESSLSELRDSVMSAMHAAIDDPELIAALTPEHEPGCKRILVSDDYYPALAKPHVTLVPHAVTTITNRSVVAANGEAFDVDVVVYCTGYKLGGRTDGRPAVEVFGRDGIDLRHALAEAPEAYRGVAIPGFPNYFTVCGINGAAGHAPVFLSAEVHTDYIGRWIQHMRHEGVAELEVKTASTRQYNAAIQSELSEMVWAGDCPGWYRDRSGRVLPFHPGTWTRMRRELRELCQDDFILTERPSETAGRNSPLAP